MFLQFTWVQVIVKFQFINFFRFHNENFNRMQIKVLGSKEKQNIIMRMSRLRNLKHPVCRHLPIVITLEIKI